MGMNSELICIGPFDPALVNHYQYEPGAYAGVQPGTLIVTSIFGGGLPASSLSRDFADALGIEGNPLGAEGLPIDSEMIRRDDLLAFAMSEPGSGLGPQIEALLALAAAGYDIFFFANG
jgi:hypothetical protein